MKERRQPSIVRTATVAAALVAASALAVMLAAGSISPRPARAAVAKGIIDHLLAAQPAESAARAGMIREIDRRLGAKWVRVVVY